MMSRDVDLLDMQSKLLGWLRKKMPQASNFTISDFQTIIVDNLSKIYAVDFFEETKKYFTFPIFKEEG